VHQLKLQVAEDHVERLTKVKKPILAIEELIWNSLDADATEVRVELTESRLGGLERITVKDNGHGIRPDVCDDAFASLGGSPKLRKSISPTGRQIHGSSGQGRFKAFGLATRVDWTSSYRDDSRIYHFKISGRRENLKVFEVGEPEEGGDASGVTVELFPDANHHPLLDVDGCVVELSKRLALYLRKYPGIKVFYDGCRIDPSKMEDHVQTYAFDVQLPEGKFVPAELTVIEWNYPTERALYLCDKGGFAKDERPPGIQAKGWNFTAYVKSAIVEEVDESNAFALDELHPGMKALLEHTKDALRTHFRRREEEQAAELVQQWKAEEVYPYETEDADPLVRAEREVFNVCAVKVHEYLPTFEESDRKNKRLTFQLLRQALESNPSSVQKILREVLALPEEQQNELANLLERTRLSAIINASRIVLDRLDFLASLDTLLFGQFKEQLLETKQLHQILLPELWVFGEQYHLGVDDQSLKSLLEKHVSLLDREQLVSDVGEVTDLDGKSRRVDLLLYQRFPLGTPNSFEHLVIELKRPSKRLGKTELGQIEEYAFKVADDERFDKDKVKWTFLIVGNDLDNFAKQKCNIQDREFGHIHAGNPNIYVKKWSSLIDQAKWRYEFFRERLETEISSDHGLEYLRRKYPEFIPDSAIKAE